MGADVSDCPHCGQTVTVVLDDGVPVSYDRQWGHYFPHECVVLVARETVRQELCELDELERVGRRAMWADLESVRGQRIQGSIGGWTQ